MRRIVLAAVLVATAGCDLSFLSPTATNNNHNGGCSTCPPGGGGTPTPAPCSGSAMTCTPVPFDATGKASSFRVTHSCGSVTLTCTSDGGAVQTFDGVASGVELDPLAGAGTYTCRSSAGAVCTVGLDS